ncbi:MAG: hypothetical protein JO225_03320 [Candidatus Eremiobacteraeota bacterium]|nr:hypothetical protein [Candidatus Eremiobacteraeota bacterium]MBV8642925.1 hypothetical protein [Candidatus Eremiobacteraeota bacterium]
MDGLSAAPTLPTVTTTYTSHTWSFRANRDSDVVVESDDSFTQADGPVAAAYHIVGIRVRWVYRTGLGRHDYRA